MLEDAARRAIEGAGFVPAPDGITPDVSVQLGARITETDRSPFDDPFWYGGYRPLASAVRASRFGRPYWGPGWRRGFWGPGNDFPYYEREVARPDPRQALRRAALRGACRRAKA